MRNIKENVWLLAVIICAILLTVYTLGSLVTDPAHSFASLGGDGAKNEFAYLYQCVYGNGFWFDGMNYPYGDNIVFSDGQATLSVLLNTCTKVNAEQALTILWLLIGLSYILSVVFVYRILRHFGVAYGLAAIFSCLITFFSPQLFRISGHFGLSYLCVVPMLFYWTIKYNEREHWRYCVYIFVLGIIIAFLHPYFSGMVLVWGMFYIAGYFLFAKRSIQGKFRHIVPVLAGTITVLAIVWMIMHITDPVKDRPVAPYGMLVYRTTCKDIFTSHTSALWHPLLKYDRIRRHTTDEGEGYVYPGIVTIAVFLCSLITGIVYRHRRDRLMISDKKFDPVWMFMAIAALLFGMGVPYIWKMEWLLNYMSFMRQFRSLGRFSWIFYHIISIYAAVVIYTSFTRLLSAGRTIIAYAGLILVIAVWAFEAGGYVNHIHTMTRAAHYNYDMFFSKNQQNWEAFLKEHHYSKDDFQAILILNFFHVGSDKLWVDEPGWKMTLGGKASFQLHKPIVDALMSRTSWSQTQALVKIAAGPFVQKPLVTEIKNRKPFLLMRYEEDSLNEDEQYLLAAADTIGHYSQCWVLAYYPDRQLANDKRNTDSVNNILPFTGLGDTCIGSKCAWYTDHMDGGKASDKFFGRGASAMVSKKEYTVATIPVRPVTDKQSYEFSCWFLLSDKTYASPWFRLESLDSMGHIIQVDMPNTKNSVDNDGLWFRCSSYIRLSSRCVSLRCVLQNDPMPSYIVMDELMLRPADALIISRSADGSVMVNNHLFKKAK